MHSCVCMCVLFAYHCTIMELLSKSCPVALVHPNPLYLPLSLFQVQRRLSNAITLTIWWEHQLNCCCFSAAWPAYRSNTASHTQLYAHTHTYTHTHLLACVQIQIKPYGPSLSSFTVCNSGAVEGQEQPTPAFAGHRKREDVKWCMWGFSLSVKSGDIPALLLPKAT